jgi:gas vesicle protein
MSKSTTNVVIGFMAGAAAGALTGILFAPEKGSITRKKIKKNADKVGAGISDQVDEMKDYISDFVDEVKDRFSTLEKEVKEQAKKATTSATGKS